jgi:hypothetical protein
MKPVWTLEQARNFLRLLEHHVTRAGYGIALGGSVLMRGQSYKDLDVIVFPLNTYEMATSKYGCDLRESLQAYGPGCRLIRGVDEVHDAWRARGSTDSKWVEIWEFVFEGEYRRVDIFILS